MNRITHNDEGKNLQVFMLHRGLLVCFFLASSSNSSSDQVLIKFRSSFDQFWFKKNFN